MKTLVIDPQALILRSEHLQALEDRAYLARDYDTWRDAIEEQSLLDMILDIHYDHERRQS